MGSGQWSVEPMVRSRERRDAESVATGELGSWQTHAGTFPVEETVSAKRLNSSSSSLQTIPGGESFKSHPKLPVNKYNK